MFTEIMSPLLMQLTGVNSYVCVRDQYSHISNNLKEQNTAWFSIIIFMDTLQYKRHKKFFSLHVIVRDIYIVVHCLSKQGSEAKNIHTLRKPSLLHFFASYFFFYVNNTQLRYALSDFFFLFFLA